MGNYEFSPEETIYTFGKSNPKGLTMTQIVIRGFMKGL